MGRLRVQRLLGWAASQRSGKNSSRAVGRGLDAPAAAAGASAGEGVAASAAGSPASTENGYAESFHSRLRDEFLWPGSPGRDRASRPASDRTYRRANPPRDRELSGGDDALAPLRRARLCAEQIASQLQSDKLVVGQVAIERVEDSIAIPPRVRQRAIDVLARGVGIANHVEPVTPPTDTVLGRSRQALDESRVCAG